jgi:Fe-S cluster assembly ATP-binding protein
VGKDLLALAPEERAREGMFLAFQYPVEIPGSAMSICCGGAERHPQAPRGEPESGTPSSSSTAASTKRSCASNKREVMQMMRGFLKRGVNEGFSGGEKKRNEILQMLMLEPKPGAARRDGFRPRHRRAARSSRRASTACAAPERSIVLVTHYQRLLDYIEPDRVHVLADGPGCLLASTLTPGYQRWPH